MRGISLLFLLGLLAFEAGIAWHRHLAMAQCVQERTLIDAIVQTEGATQSVRKQIAEPRNKRDQSRLNSGLERAARVSSAENESPAGKRLEVFRQRDGLKTYYRPLLDALHLDSTKSRRFMELVVQRENINDDTVDSLYKLNGGRLLDSDLFKLGGEVIALEKKESDQQLADLLGPDGFTAFQQYGQRAPADLAITEIQQTLAAIGVGRLSESQALQLTQILLNSMKSADKPSSIQTLLPVGSGEQGYYFDGFRCASVDASGIRIDPLGNVQALVPIDGSALGAASAFLSSEQRDVLSKMKERYETTALLTRRMNEP